MSQIINNCGMEFPVEFLQLLASTLMKDDEGKILGFNAMLSSATNCECTPVINCDNNGVDFNSFLPLGFGIDACGRLAIKFVTCDGSGDRT